MIMHGANMLLVLAAFTLSAVASAAVVPGQKDDFEDGTVQGWIVGLQGAPHPDPPVNVPNGGPAGAGDNFLQFSSIGGSGPGSRLTILNATQWAGDYAGSGVGGVVLDVNNFSSTDVYLRLLLEDAAGGPPTNIALTSAVIVPAGSGWVSASFSLAPADLTVLAGDVDVLLSNTTILRIFHNPNPSFPGPGSVATVGVDNIEALSSSTPTLRASWGQLKNAYR